MQNALHHLITRDSVHYLLHFRALNVECAVVVEPRDMRPGYAHRYTPQGMVAHVTDAERDLKLRDIGRNWIRIHKEESMHCMPAIMLPL